MKRALMRLGFSQVSAHAHSKLQEDQHNNQMLVVESRRQATPNTLYLPVRPSTFP